MKVAFIADVHGNHEALDAVFDDLGDEADALCFLGDLAGYHDGAAVCLETLAAHDALTIAGNHDAIAREALVNGATDPGYDATYGAALARDLVDAPADLRRWLTGTPLQARWDLDGVRVLAVHGAPWDPLDGRVYPDFDRWDRFDDIDADVVAMAHTHHAFSRRTRGPFLVNPGSVGQARDQRGLAAYAVMDTERLTVQARRVPYPLAPLVARIPLDDPARPRIIAALEGAPVP